VTSIDIDRAARRMREAQSRIGSVMEDPYTWSNENENCTSSVREAAKLLDLEPGKLNGYMEVWRPFVQFRRPRSTWTDSSVWRKRVIPLGNLKVRGLCIWQ